MKIKKILLIKLQMIRIHQYLVSIVEENSMKKQLKNISHFVNKNSK